MRLSVGPEVWYGRYIVLFCQPAEPLCDSTASACAACGMLEIAKCLSGAESKKYAQAAMNILRCCDERCRNYEMDRDALALMGSEIGNNQFMQYIRCYNAFCQ